MATGEIDTTVPENVPVAIAWQRDRIIRLSEAIKPHLNGLAEAMNSAP
jgi:hypothetical protein